jgi:hypothetical protein
LQSAEKKTMTTQPPSHKKFIFALVALLILLAAAFPLGTAQAGLTICRTDPIVFLDDGTRVTLTSTIYTDIENVSGVVYELHIPEGMSVSRIVYTANALGGRETAMVYSDNPAQTYTAFTTVSAVETVPLTTWMDINSVQSYSMDGVTGTSIAVEATYVNSFRQNDAAALPDAVGKMAISRQTFSMSR